MHVAIGRFFKTKRNILYPFRSICQRENLKHGPIALIENGVTVINVITNPRFSRKMY